jgi:hypothetical protein
MPLFGRKGNAKVSMPAPDPATTAGEAIGALLEARLTDAEGRIRVEDLLSAGAAVCGEACIAAAGEFDPENHQLVPGSAVLSDRINDILCANATDWAKTGTSVFGIIHTRALRSGFAHAVFPDLADIFRVYVSLLGGGEADRWGFVGLSVPEDNWPRTPPLRFAYELRVPVRELLARHGVATESWPAATAIAVATELGRVREAIDNAVAIRIVLETTNGMAKMAPMTDRHFREAAEAPG